MTDKSFSELARILTELSLKKSEPLDPPQVREEDVILLSSIRPQLLEDIAASSGLFDEEDDLI